MRDRDRCECCGSWEAECSSDTPQKGCGCMRCAAAENNRLLKEIQTWKEKYEDLEINRADCCVQMEKERDEARKQLADLQVDEEAEARFEKLLARNRDRKSTRLNSSH